MAIFNKKKEYIIITKRAMVGDVRKFAEEHCVEGYEIDVHVHGCLLEDDYLVRITFISCEDEGDVYSELIDKFGNDYRIASGRKLMFVLDKLEEES